VARQQCRAYLGDFRWSLSASHKRVGERLILSPRSRQNATQTQDDSKIALVWPVRVRPRSRGLPRSGGRPAVYGGWEGASSVVRRCSRRGRIAMRSASPTNPPRRDGPMTRFAGGPVNGAEELCNPPEPRPERTGPENRGRFKRPLEEAHRCTTRCMAVAWALHTCCMGVASVLRFAAR
jgi:hypothetical protein